MQLPIDLRRPLASSILVTGGTAMLPGLFPRLRHHLQVALAASHPPSPPPTPPSADAPTPPPPAALVHAALKARLHTSRHAPRFGPLAALASSVALVNDPSGGGGRGQGLRGGGGTAYAPAVVGWVGGSVVGALKGGGEEVGRERWEEVREGRRGRGGGGGEEGDEEEGMWVGVGVPDWTELGKRGGGA